MKRKIIFAFSILIIQFLLLASVKADSFPQSITV